MKIRLLKSFFPDTFIYQIDEKARKVYAMNRMGNPYTENVDYSVDDRDKPGIEIEHATGITTSNRQT